MSAKQRSGAVDVPADDLVTVAADPKAFDRKIAALVAARESAHDRERRAVAAEKALEETELALRVAKEALERDAARLRKDLDAREAAVAEREAAVVPRELRIEEFQRMINAA